LIIRISVRGRRNAKPSELVMAAAMLLPVAKAAAKARQRKNRRLGRRARRGSAADIVAARLGVSRATLSRATAVVASGFVDLVEQMDRSGKVNRAWREMMTRRAAPGCPQLTVPRRDSNRR
jgi:hypothetical protein